MWNNNEATADEIAELVQDTFKKLPPKCKPQTIKGYVYEWVPLSGIVAKGHNGLTCLSVASGMKCLPQNRVPHAHGRVLHDWHAEVLAIRTFNRHLLEECRSLIELGAQTSGLLRRRLPDEITEEHFQPFALRDEIQLYMYCSEAPCGDASMELTMAAQKDPTPWSLPRSDFDNLRDPAPENQPEDQEASTDNESPQLLGRGYFSKLGIVRRKPARPDAPPTLSKSCTDKIALKQSTSLLNSVTSLLISPENAYIKCLVLSASQKSPVACERAFSVNGRLAPLRNKVWDGGYRFQQFEVRGSSVKFSYSRNALMGYEKIKSSNVSACWSPSGFETLVGGNLHGRKHEDPKGASRVCKLRTWEAAIEVAELLGNTKLQEMLRQSTYRELKNAPLLENRREVKKDVRSDALKGWPTNDPAGEEFGLP